MLTDDYRVKMLTYDYIVDEIMDYFNECFVNELEETRERNYDVFIDNLIDDVLNVTPYSEVFERTYEYCNINMPATIRMMNFIMEHDAEQYTLLADGARAIISVFAFYIVREACNSNSHYKDEFKYNWMYHDGDTMFGA